MYKPRWRQRSVCISTLGFLNDSSNLELPDLFRWSMLCPVHFIKSWQHGLTRYKHTAAILSDLVKSLILVKY